MIRTTGSSVALDTNIAIDLMQGRREAVAFLKECGEVLLPLPVLGELRYGALLRPRPEEHEARIDEMLKDTGVLEMTEATARAYATIRTKLRRTGTPIPGNDLWIAAQCVAQTLPLATRDQHFERVTDLERILPYG